MLQETPIPLGRREKILRRFGYKGMAYLGRVVLGKGEAAALGRPVLLDLSESHVVLVFGKRGYGKSYTLGVILEEFDRLPFSVRSRLAVVNIDTAGVFWTMKFPNEEDEELLASWNLKPRAVENIEVYVPKKVMSYYLSHDLPVDGAFVLNPAELSVDEWLWLLNTSIDSEVGVKLVEVLEKLDPPFGIEEMIERAEGTDVASRSLRARLKVVKSWELFEEDAPSIKDYAKGGKITNIDVSTFRGSSRLQEVVVALLGRKLFEERMLAKKGEDIALVEHKPTSFEMPIVWMVIDEAHLFAPKRGESLSRDILRIWAKVGRQPGLALILATQQPSDLDDALITQADVFISHRLTSYLDLKALEKIKPSYVPTGLSEEISKMGHRKGLAIVLDDVTERLLLVQIRPRMSLHGGSSASALRTSLL